ncbi:MAG: pyruvate formate lyase-activating protein [Clostridia bacterium]|nr:pyruvate formate lyase-activating protein [Clostridia bacterium]
MTGKLHSIETFGTVDGPGVRFVVFFQGCPMRCAFCHNPDTWHVDDAQLTLEAEDVIERMLRNLPFYRTGGITASGGEPLCQLDFLTELFTLAKQNGIHTALDTSGATFSRDSEYMERFERLMAVTDLVMLDIKHADETAHLALTSYTGRQARELAAYLASIGKPLRIRHVLLPGITDTRESLIALARLIKTLGPLECLELLPYHNLGRVKYERLGIPYKMADARPLTADDIARARAIIDGELYGNGS